MCLCFCGKVIKSNGFLTEECFVTKRESDPILLTEINEGTFVNDCPPFSFQSINKIPAFWLQSGTKTFLEKTNYFYPTGYWPYACEMMMFLEYRKVFLVYAFLFTLFFLPLLVYLFVCLLAQLLFICQTIHLK